MCAVSFDLAKRTSTCTRKCKYTRLRAHRYTQTHICKQTQTHTHTHLQVFDLLMEYAMDVMSNRFSKTQDVVSRVLGGGVSNRWLTRLCPIQDYLLSREKKVSTHRRHTHTHYYTSKHVCIYKPAQISTHAQRLKLQQLRDKKGVVKVDKDDVARRFFVYVAQSPTPPLLPHNHNHTLTYTRQHMHTGTPVLATTANRPRPTSSELSRIL